ncbi:enoyl-CoA hydratase [Niallia endozanthoxylica]|uniref:Enoyl-CoA hydratase n=1 Tax=Niallia endozanthoxylica TaxID=2036016 RepID=A0A5J5HPN6_9BACI|nr:enoyl-CoA hydratase [Niallia endozanthoxylica]KAA9023186.1 enoyl-CoA hydratase [Niallia endozanthoxylica]
MENVKWSYHDRVVKITLKRPPANALSSVTLKELSSVLDEIEKNDELRVVIIHGEGRFFSAGADIKEFTSIKSNEQFAQYGKYGQDLFERIEIFAKPIIACIHGAALGGGLELAMACHFRIVAEDAKLGLPELQLGLIPGFAGTQRLPKYVGVARAAEMLLTSKAITGTEAVQYGLANHAFPEQELLNKTEEIAKFIAKKSPASIKAVITLLNAAKTKEYYAGVEKEAELFGEVFSSNDAKEGISAFIEKREPEFKGN